MPFETMPQQEPKKEEIKPLQLTPEEVEQTTAWRQAGVPEPVIRKKILELHKKETTTKPKPKPETRVEPEDLKRVQDDIKAEEVEIALEEARERLKEIERGGKAI